MKNIKLYAVALMSMLALSSCNDFLDKLPDDRAEVDTEKDVNDLLSTAYSGNLPAYVLEMSSDNVTDNGSQYTAQPDQEKIYRFQEVTETGNDLPRNLWQGGYVAIATANQVLESIESVGGTSLNPQRAEALLCRAWGMFELSRVFCMAYDPTKASQYLGLPYPTEPEKDINTEYTRGTLEELYAKINADIEAALPLVDDAHLSSKSAKYHFNQRAAYAFAARFNLYYQKWEKAAQYASVALGAAPASLLRGFNSLNGLAGVDDISNAYVNSGVAANFMLQTAYSIAGRALGHAGSWARFNHNREIVEQQTIWAEMPWGSGSTVYPNNNWTTYFALGSLLYGSNQGVYFPKQMEFFEVTDKVAQTGFPHIVAVQFSAEETLLVRAEANTLLGNYDAALADINLVQTSFCASGVPALTTDVINEFFDDINYAKVEPINERENTIKKQLHPQGFTVQAGTQENFIHMILQMRRIETLFTGLRFQDIKRYGIEFSHALDGENAVVFTAGDLRGALQLPEDVYGAGLEKNPR